MSDIKTHVASGWVEAAAPTHGGHCPDDPTQTTGPAWDWIEHDAVKGTWGSGQCGGCGQLGMGWVQTGARRLPDNPIDHDDFIEALKAEAVALRDEEFAHMRSVIRADLAERLAAAIATMPDRPPVECEDEWNDWETTHSVSLSGTGSGPIFYDPATETLTAWAWDPDDSGEGITVTPDDLTDED